MRWRSRLLSSEGMVWMQAALPSALLADMSEQQQMDLALELSITTADARSTKVASTWAEELLENKAKAESRQAAILDSFATENARRRKMKVLDADEVVIDEAATASAARKRKMPLEQAAARALEAAPAVAVPPPPGSARARAIEAAYRLSKRQLRFAGAGAKRGSV